MVGIDTLPMGRPTTLTSETRISGSTASHASLYKIGIKFRALQYIPKNTQVSMICCKTFRSSPDVVVRRYLFEDTHIICFLWLLLCLPCREGVDKSRVTGLRPSFCGQCVIFCSHRPSGGPPGATAWGLKGAEVGEARHMLGTLRAPSV